MEGIGEKLRNAREARRLSIKEVVKETNISPLYIEALEDEDFDKFPSETYLVGFLRSYSEYLRLNSDEIVQKYKGYKIGESATPLEELTRPTNSTFFVSLSQISFKYKNILYTAGVAVAAFILIWGLKIVFSSSVDTTGGDSIDKIKEEYNATNRGAEIKSIRNLQLQNDSGFVLVYKNEAVQFLVDKKEVVFILKEINLSDSQPESVAIEVLPGRINEKLSIDSTKVIKIEGTERDINFSLKGLTENRAKIMVFLGEKPKAPESEIVQSDSSVPSGDNTTVAAQSKKNLKIIFEAEFIDKSYIELYLDGAQRARSFIPSGSRERWEASENIQVKIGNAGGVKIKINGKDYSFGGAGQVANKVITWKKDISDPNLYHIVVRDW